MNGPSHYAEAERLLASSKRDESGRASSPSPLLAAQAQVHATLALVAATALAAFDPEGRGLVSDPDWGNAVLGDRT